MEWAKVIQSKLAIWITNYRFVANNSKGYYLNGNPIDGYFGFGEQNVNHYSGKAILLSPENKDIKNISISRIHTTRDNWRWKIENLEEIPKTPFLISSDFNLEVIFDGYIELIDKQDVIDVLEPDDYAYAVVSHHFFGIIQVKEKQKVSLIAFSSNPESEVSSNDEIWTLEWDCSIGRIKVLYNSHSAAK